MAIWASTSSAGADYQAWSDTTHVFLNTSSGGAGVNVTLLSFPLLVRLNGSNFDFSKARGAGQDIRFSTSSGAPLPYQIERWDSAGSKAELWVLVDSVKGNDAGQYVNMYCGNPQAADSSNGGAVFTASKGLYSVFHMGGSGASARANSVAGGAAASPVNFDGDESRGGIIGLCDSLDGGAPGDWLDLGGGYGDLAGGFTYSAWVYPSAVKSWGRFLELGNPVGTDMVGHDAICIGREGVTNHLITHLYLLNNVRSLLRSDSYITENAWQFVTVAITNNDSTVRWYKNGSLVGTARMGAPLSPSYRQNNWMGRSGWSADQYFQGKLDEVRIARQAQSAAWIKLSYETQRPDQISVTLRAPSRCQASFAPPPDTTVSEGDGITLAARADCADSYNWNAQSGPVPRLPDPDVKVLQFAAPRVAGDTVLVLRFSAAYGDSLKTRDVRVTVMEAIPEPVFTVPRSITWTTQDTIQVSVSLSNLAAIKASRDSILNQTWSLTGLDVDTTWGPGYLVLRNPASDGRGQVTACLSNNSPPVCHSTEVVVSRSTGLAPASPAALVRPGVDAPRRSVNGRWMPAWDRIRKAYPATPAAARRVTHPNGKAAGKSASPEKN